MIQRTCGKGKTYWSGGGAAPGISVLQIREHRSCLGAGSLTWPDDPDSFNDEMRNLSRFLDFTTVWELLELVDDCGLFNYYPGYMLLDGLADEFDRGSCRDAPPSFVEFADIVAQIDRRLVPSKCEYGHLAGRRYLNRRTTERLYRDMPQGIACEASLHDLLAVRSILDMSFRVQMACRENLGGDCLIASGWRQRDGYYEWNEDFGGATCSMLNMGEDREDSLDGGYDGIVAVFSREGFMSGMRTNARHASSRFIAPILIDAVDEALSRYRVDNVLWSGCYSLRSLDDGPIYTHRISLWRDMLRALVEGDRRITSEGWAVRRCSCGRYFIRREGVGRPREKCGRCR